MTDDGELMFVIWMNAPLIKECRTVHYRYVLAVSNQREHVRLQRQRICVRLRDSIKTTNVDNDASFSFHLFILIGNVLSDTKY